MAELTITKDNFEEIVLKADKPVLIDFWADWCGPCKMLGPIVKEVADELDGNAIVGKVNVDEQEELSEKYGIVSIPTLIVFKNGEQVKKTVGVQSKAAIIDLLS